MELILYWTPAWENHATITYSRPATSDAECTRFLARVDYDGRRNWLGQYDAKTKRCMFVVDNEDDRHYPVRSNP